METIQLDENGDIIFDSLGKLKIIRDKDALKQSIIIRLKTLKGDLFYNDNYGHMRLKGKHNQDSILDYLKDALLDDERINDIEIVSFAITAFGKYKVDAEIYLETGEILDFDFSI